MKLKKHYGVMAVAVSLLFTGCDFLFDSPSSVVPQTQSENLSSFYDAAKLIKEQNYGYIDEPRVKLDVQDNGKILYTINYNVSSKTYVNYNSIGRYETEISDKIGEDLKQIKPDSKLNLIPDEIASVNSKFRNFKLYPDYNRATSDSGNNLKLTKNYSVNDKENFYVKDKDMKDKVTEALCVAKGEHCFIWFVDNAKPELKVKENLSEGTFADLANKFDAMYNLETAIFGSNIPTKSWSNISVSKDYNGKVHVIVTDIQCDSYEGQESGLYGYFYNADLYTNEYIQKSPQTNGVYSNECEVVYIDSYLLSSMKETLYSTLSHEFQHLLGFINKTVNNNEGYTEWFTEMLSMCCEELMQDTLGTPKESLPSTLRLPLFNLYTYYGFTDIWNKTPSKSSKPVINSGTFEYATTYAFGTYLMHNFGGVKLINKIATNEYVDKKAITEALHACNYEDETFESVFLKFAQICVNLENCNETDKLSLNRSSQYPVNDATVKIYPIDLTSFSYEVNKNDLKNLFDDLSNPDYCYPDNIVVDNNVVTFNGPVQWKLTFSLYPNGFEWHRRGTIEDITEPAAMKFTLPTQKEVLSFYMKK